MPGLLFGAGLGLIGEGAKQAISADGNTPALSVVGAVVGAVGGGRGRGAAIGAIAGAAGGFAEALSPGQFQNTAAGIIGGGLGTFVGQLAIPNKPYASNGIPLFSAARGLLGGFAGGLSQDLIEALLKGYECKNVPCSR